MSDKDQRTSCKLGHSATLSSPMIRLGTSKPHGLSIERFSLGRNCPRRNERVSERNSADILA
jgi:hypothetical protein